MSIPCLLILKSLEDYKDHDDNEVQDNKNICKRFLPKMFKEGEEAHKKYNELREEY